MEYVDGCSLTEIIENNMGNLSESIIAAIALKVTINFPANFFFSNSKSKNRLLKD